MIEKTFDVVIVGAGPSGLTAAMYLRRNGKSVAIIERAMPGGQMTLTYEIKNYPGYAEISGMELGQKMLRQSLDIGAEILYDEVSKVETAGELKILHLRSSKVSAKAIIIASGARPKTLPVENFDKFVGRGISFCAVCDGAFYKGRNVVVAGGGNSAVEDITYLSGICNSVTVVHTYPEFRAQAALLDEHDAVTTRNKNVTYLFNHQVTEVFGDTTLQSVTAKNKVTGEETEIITDGMFVAIGRLPNTEFAKDLLEFDEYSQIIVDNHQQTSVPGIFACGDVTNNHLKQIVLATGQGAVAAVAATSYINNLM